MCYFFLEIFPKTVRQPHQGMSGYQRRATPEGVSDVFYKAFLTIDTGDADDEPRF
jgi:hypothetical protein